MSDFDRRQYALGVARILVLFVAYVIALSVGSTLTWTARALPRLRTGTKRVLDRLSRKRRKPREA